MSTVAVEVVEEVVVVVVVVVVMMLVAAAAVTDLQRPGEVVEVGKAARFKGLVTGATMRVITRYEQCKCGWLQRRCCGHTGLSAEGHSTESERTNV